MQERHVPPCLADDRPSHAMLRVPSAHVGGVPGLALVDSRWLGCRPAASGRSATMGELSRSTVVACPPQRVFEVLADVDRLPEFSGMTVEVRSSPGRAVRAGDQFEQVVRVLGKELETTWKVVEIVEPSLLRFEGTGPGGARATLVERLTAEGSGTRVQLEVDYDLPLGLLGDAVDAVYLHGKNEEEAEDILAKLKDLCETG